MEKWWEDYAYCTDRTPILPFCAMAAVLLTESVNIEISPEYRLKVRGLNILNSPLTDSPLKYQVDCGL